MNNEHLIFGDVMYRKEQNPNEPIHLFIGGGASIGKTFTLMLLIQALIHFYNRHPHSDPF
jgi:pantothenate kinase-related protein Tda10